VQTDPSVTKETKEFEGLSWTERGIVNAESLKHLRLGAGFGCQGLLVNFPCFASRLVDS